MPPPPPSVPVQVARSRTELPERFVPVSGRSARPATVGGTWSTLTEVDDVGAAGPGVAFASATLSAASVRPTVPVEQPARATCHTLPEPVGEPMTHPVAVPLEVKSA